MSRRGLVGLAVASASLPVLAAEGGGGGSALVRPVPGLMIWTTITFVALLILLRRVAWKPLLGAIEAREKSIRDSLEQTRRDRDEAQSLVEENRAILNQARRERAEAVEAGRRDAERLKEDILTEARRQKDQLLVQADSQIQASLREAQAELKTAAADLAVQAASKLLARNLDDATQRKLVEDYIADLERQPPGSASLPS